LKRKFESDSGPLAVDRPKQLSTSLSTVFASCRKFEPYFFYVECSRHACRPSHSFLRSTSFSSSSYPTWL